jgi:dihydrofolate reductase
MILSHIVAAAENDVIGAGNRLPWDIPEDMKFFKDKTAGHAIIMGRKTYESMGKPLPNRLNVIVSRQKDYIVAGARVVPTIEEAIKYCKTKSDQYGHEIFIIGGGEIYRQSLNYVNVVYLTRIHRPIAGDATYPKLDPDRFKEIERRDRPGDPPFTFLTFVQREPAPVP